MHWPDRKSYDSLCVTTCTTFNSSSTTMTNSNVRTTHVETDPGSLQREDWNDLESNYDKHDIGQAYLTGHLHQIGLQIEHWGLDQREDDGLTFDNRMDLRLWEPLDGQDEPVLWDPTYARGDYEVLAGPESYLSGGKGDWKLRALVDVKSKANSDWYPIFNLRHLVHYAEHAQSYQEPALVFFTMVDEDAETVGEESCFVNVPTDWDYHRLADHYDRDTETDMTYGECKDAARTCSLVQRTFRAPDGNLVVVMEEDERKDFSWFTENVL